MQKPFHMPAAEIAQRIGLPLDRWMTNCHVVVRGMLAKGLAGSDVEARELRPGPWPDPSCPSELLQFHVFLRLPANGWVVDPTRWCYEGKGPEEAYIYYGDGDGVEYGGARLPWAP